MKYWSWRCVWYMAALMATAWPGSPRVVGMASDQITPRSATDTDGAAADPATTPRRPPHLITILIDDLGWSDLSCFGGTDVQTPHIDQLASEGLRFNSFYVNSPICSPSRTALITGQYPARHRITSFLASRRENETRGIAHWLDVQAVTLPRLLWEAGYATGHFGKWHLGGQRDVGEAPLITEYGFDTSLTNFEGLGPRVLPLKDAFDGQPPQPHALGSDQLGRGPITWETRALVTQRFVDQALAFLSDPAHRTQPMFVNIWPDDVHSPFFPPRERRGDGSKRSLYLGVLQTLDEQLGRLFQHVRQDPQLRDNTLIVLASDNGPEPGAGRSEPLRGAKGELWEGGVRSPLIVWGPGLLDPAAAGRVNDSAVLSSVDLTASLLALAGVPRPATDPPDGENLLPTLLGRDTTGRRQPLFWRRPPDRPSTRRNPRPDLAVRSDRWKLVCRMDGSAPQLFDVVADIGETQNMAAAHPELTQQLTAAALQWNQSLPADAGVQPVSANAPLPPGFFVNPMAEGADPWVIRDPHAPRFLWCQSEGNRGIAIWTSDRLSSSGQKHVVWMAPDEGPYSREIWAPELHWLDQHWYIYFAASNGHNEHHLTWVLRSDTADPLGTYSLHGPLATGSGPDGRSPNLWAIDMTVLEHRGQRYAVWSGWDAPGTDQQYLYIAPLQSPTELGGPRVRLCRNDDHLWERTEESPNSRGLHEAPQVLQHGGRTFVVYSTGASWLPTYKLGLLELIGENPLQPAAWHKFPEPVFRSSDTVLGPGHSCFICSADRTEWWHVFHAKRDAQPGWRRALHVQPMRFDDQGTPQFGQPLPVSTELPVPFQNIPAAPVSPVTAALTDSRPLSGWSWYGHHQFLKQTAEGVHLGCVPSAGINTYRCGEKLVLDGLHTSNFTAAVTIRFLQGDRDAGLLFRTTAPAVGYDAQRGYFAGLIPGTGLVVLGRTDGQSWQELARAPAKFDPQMPQRLQVTAREQQIEVRLNGAAVLQVADNTWNAGSVGLRVVNTHAVFSQLEVTFE